jgi:hypothetical protein
MNVSRVAAWATYVACARTMRLYLDVCAEAGIETLIVKGAVTAFLLYDDVAERPLTDVDARVRPDDLSRLSRAASSRGFRVVYEGGAYGGLTLLHRDVPVDVETHVGAPHMTALGMDDLFAARTFVKHPDGYEVPTLETSHHAFFLAVNCFKDKLAGAQSWALEDARRIVRCPDFSADALVRVARRARAVTLLYLVADHFAREGHEEWANVRRLVSPPPRPLYAALWKRLAARRSGSSAFRLLTRLVSDSPRAWPRAAERALAAERERRARSR